MYGGRDYLVSQLNNATQGVTQAGSSFKPFALVAALEQGIPISSVWNGSSPKVFDDAGKPYPVYNYDSEQFGNVDLAFATAHSINTVFVPLGIKAGPDKIVDVARRAGIPTSVALMPTPSISLGVASPHVIDVANSYATFAANGTYAKPFIVKEVLGNNQGVLYESRVEAQQVFEPNVMADLDVALQAVTKYGTAAAAGATLGRPSAGKTGTTTDNASAWFNGYTPQLATSVALFKDDATQSLNGLGGVPSVTGGTFPASIWALYMKAALKDEPKLAFPAPANIGGTDAVNMVDAVPTLDPSLAPKLTKTKSKKK
jgi:membrane peptidoglycan carboxypeptidase